MKRFSYDKPNEANEIDEGEIDLLVVISAQAVYKIHTAAVSRKVAIQEPSSNELVIYEKKSAISCQ